MCASEVVAWWKSVDSKTDVDDEHKKMLVPQSGLDGNFFKWSFKTKVNNLVFFLLL